MENGYETIRHRSHLTHNVWKYTQMDETKVRFNLPEGDAKDNPDSDESVVNLKAEGHKMRRRE